MVYTGQNFLKGMLCTFPILSFAKKINGGNYIVRYEYIKMKNDEYIKADLRDMMLLLRNHNLNYGTVLIYGQIY